MLFGGCAVQPLAPLSLMLSLSVNPVRRIRRALRERRRRPVGRIRHAGIERDAIDALRIADLGLGARSTRTAAGAADARHGRRRRLAAQVARHGGRGRRSLADDGAANAARLRTRGRAGALAEADQAGGALVAEAAHAARLHLLVLAHAVRDRRVVAHVAAGRPRRAPADAARGRGRADGAALAQDLRLVVGVEVALRGRDAAAAARRVVAVCG